MKLFTQIINSEYARKAGGLYGLIFILQLCLLPLAAQDLPTVAIMEFEPSGMSATDAANITSRFSYELSRTNRFRITEREMMKAILDEQEFQLSGCTSSECVVEVGQLLSVEYMIAGEVTKTFDLYSLHVRLISVESGEVLAQVVEDYEGAARDFITGTVRNAALKLAAEAGTGRGETASQSVQNVITQTGRVSFVLNVAPVNVFIDGYYSGENSTKTVNLSLPAGDHKIRLSAPGYRDYEKTLSVLPDQNIEYSVELQKGAAAVGVADVKTGIVVVRSTPDGARVYFDGRDAGTTPVQIPKAGAGRHSLRVEKALYHAYLEEIDVQPDGIVQILAELQPAFGSLTISSAPAGAVVSLNSQVKGRTPLTISELASGEYEIALTKELYHDYTEKFIITDGSENQRDITLLPAFGKLTVATEPEGAVVYLDGQERGRTPLSLDEIPSGDYTLRIVKDLYQQIETTIAIADGKTNQLNYILEPKFGTLNIAGAPPGAEITINGKAAGTLPLSNYKVAAGLVEITVKMKDYHTKTLYQEVNVGDLHNLDIRLARHTGTIVVLTDPPGAEIKLNSNNYGASPQILKEMPTGLYNLTISHPDYLTVNRNFYLDLNDRKELNIKLMTYQGSLQQQIDGLRRRQKYSVGVAAALGLLAGGLELYSRKLYGDYEDATETGRADELFDQSNSLHRISGYVAAGAGLSLAPSVYWQVDIGKLKRKLLEKK